MNWLDWVLLVLLAFSIITGLKQGLIKTVFGIAGLVVGIIFAGRFYLTLAPSLKFIPQENLAKIAAFLIIAIAIILIANIIGNILRKIISLLMLGWMDRIAGAILGLTMGTISLGVMLALLTKFNVFNLEQFISQSWMASLLLKSYPLIKGLLPSDYRGLGNFF